MLLVSWHGLRADGWLRESTVDWRVTHDMAVTTVAAVEYDEDAR